jgi:hypothetical protein
MNEARKNAWAPLITLTCLMIAAWIGLPCLSIGSLGWIGALEDTDGLWFLAVGFCAIAPAALWMLFTRYSKADEPVVKPPAANSDASPESN